MTIPVTLLSGFLGSGKTTLLQYILKSNDHGLKCAVIVNDMAELNIDAVTINKLARQSGLVQREESIVAMQNGCICCNLRSDLLIEIYRLTQENHFDYLIIESTGISEPMQVAETFTKEFVSENIEALESTNGNDFDELRHVMNEILNSGGISKLARLDTCVTVVDAVNFFQNFETANFVDNVNEDPQDERTITDLMVDQIEFADVILLNKVDLVSSKNADTIEALIKEMNPVARVFKTVNCKTDLKNTLNTGLFDFEKASTSAGWLHSIKNMEVQKNGKLAPKSETEEYGVTNFVYSRRRPFHPKRFYEMICEKFFVIEEGVEEEDEDMEECDDDEYVTDEEAESLDEDVESLDAEMDIDDRVSKKKSSVFGSVLRSKGLFWLASRPLMNADLSQAGCMMTISPGMMWFCCIPEEEWGMDEEETLAIKKDFDPVTFDRRQEIVFIGIDMKKQLIEEALDSCLLTDEEMEIYNLNSKNMEDLSEFFEDPFGKWEMENLDPITDNEEDVANR
jgi:G3E family GTPase